MKLEFQGHNERYVVEQSLLNLFPGELPVYAPIGKEDDTWAVVSLTEEQDACRVSVDLSFRGRRGQSRDVRALSGTDYEREGTRRHLIGRCFFLAAREATGVTPPWGMLSGVRPDKLITRALLAGKTGDEARNTLEREYFVSPERAALALETGSAAFRVTRNLRARDIAVYVGIPFCPNRCAYCSFVSQSVEKSLASVEPYVKALEREIRSGGEVAGRLGLRVRAFYMGGGTPTTLTPEQLDRVLSAFKASFDTADCTEWTVEAGRPDTITAEKLSVLRAHGVSRISVNPQSMDDAVLRAIGRRHTAADTLRAMGLAADAGFRHINMDLIAGLPADTPAGFEESLNRCLSLRPDNLTVHTLALKKGSRILTEGVAIPGGAAVEEMLRYAAAASRKAGYAPYYLYRQKYMSGSFENTGWCLPGAACFYNIAIMSERCSILSFGAGGATKLVDPPRNRVVRQFNPKYPEEYLARPATDRFQVVEAFYGGETAPRANGPYRNNPIRE